MTHTTMLTLGFYNTELSEFHNHTDSAIFKTAFNSEDQTGNRMLTA